MFTIKTLDAIDVPAFMDDPMSTGIKCLDELFGGEGIIRSQVVTLDAYRGSGKTTMLLQMLDSMTAQNLDARSLFVSREEPDFQLKKTSRRLGLKSALNIVGDEEDVYLEDILELMDDYDVIAVDSYSCLRVREGRMSDENKMDVLKKAAKSKECAVILVLHQTKSGAEKGGSSVGHMGDTCISISCGDIEAFGEDMRIFEVTKNRFGGCGKTLLRIGRNGYDFTAPIEETVNNDGNKMEGGQRAERKRREVKAILKLMNELEDVGDYLTLNSLDLCIEDGTDDAAFGRHHRLLKELTNKGMIMNIGGFGKKGHYELTDKGRDHLEA